MNSVGKDIFRSIHEGKWLYVEYQNSDEERTKYWISIKNINTEKRRLQRNTNINLEKEYEAIIEMYSSNKVTVPIQAFFGELHTLKSNKETLPIALVDRNVNLDQLLAIHNAINYPVAYIQGSPGTGKTTTLINTIITDFFNNKTVLFSSYNNHPIDGVFEKLTSLKYRGYTIPFPILRIASNQKIPETIKYIKELMQNIQNLFVFEDVLNQSKQNQVLAIELDGPEHHTDPKVMARDEKKKQICKDHGFTLIHVDNTYFRRYNFLKDILTEFFNGK